VGRRGALWGWRGTEIEKEWRDTEIEREIVGGAAGCGWSRAVIEWVGRCNTKS